MQYVNFVYDDNENETLYTGPVSESDAEYLRRAARSLMPLSDDAYLTGPAFILHTLAKSSYVLDQQAVYWCVEWSPGLLIIRMAPDQGLEWVALRSPVPNFGGRVPLPEDGDPDDYDWADNPQYNLVFVPWDAQFDRQEREWGQFVPADSDVQTRFENALARVNSLAEVIQTRFGDDTESWFQLCRQNLEKLCGEGLRLRPASDSDASS